MNAGAFGAEIAKTGLRDILHHNQVARPDVDQMEYGYRTSILKRNTHL